MCQKLPELQDRNINQLGSPERTSGKCFLANIFIFRILTNKWWVEISLPFHRGVDVSFQEITWRFPEMKIYNIELALHSCVPVFTLKLISRSHSGGSREVYFVRSRKLLFVCSLRPPPEELGRESLFSPGLVETWLQAPPSSSQVVGRPLSWSLCWIQWSAEGRTAAGTAGDLNRNNDYVGGGGGGGGGARFNNDISPRDALPVQSRPTDNALAGCLYDPEEPSGPCL